MSQENEFEPQILIDLAESIAKESAETLDYQDAIEVIQLVVKAFWDAGLLENDPSSSTESVEAALQVLYICKLIPKVFPGAYNRASIEIDAKKNKDDIVKALNRSIKL
ncbi:hypothetical protein SCRES2_gp58 [Synechococcus phage S-CRES2]|nr:hypothetical protein SCRES1_gp53 [Synechococcus phage S-CRES1]WGL30597.1 hypothetical protein SCRES2_gp58 [Synechococcus phage S-CRES2]